VTASNTIGGGLVALISCFDDDARSGGLFAWDSVRLEQLDDMPTTGLMIHDGALVRVLRAPEADSFGLVVQAPGDRTELTVKGHNDPHDIIWTGSSYAIACAGSNAIVHVAADGKPAGIWKAPGDGDAWHLNSLLLVAGELHVSAFGSFERHREWGEPEADPAAGFVLNVATDTKVLTGLYSPHHPRRFEDDWVVCNSGRRALTRIDAASGSTTADTLLEGWTRGLASYGRTLLVGESPGRTEPPDVTATIAVVSADTWEVLDRFAVPAREIYDIVLAPAELVRSIRV
jgi:Domain of unknown function (DUF4915)